MNNKKEIAVFKTDDESINVEVFFEDETAWLSQDQMAQLFGKAKSTINEHIKNVFSEGELMEGKTQSHEVNFYNHDVD